MYKRARLGIGYLPQETSIFRGLSVEENIIAALELSKVLSKNRHEILGNLLKDLSLTAVRKSPALSISGGERRKLEIARALALNPKFILLDEPLAGIDPLAIQDMRDMISSLKNRKIGVIITDHNVRDTLPMIDRGYIIFDGKIIAEGTAEEITKNETSKKMYFGENLFK
jgi:lipopolysaccharide export system ATP-binding protein